ncbi:MAG: heavy metal translocating P-type ATPase, partial [Desulfovibrionaceae bacterium]|nr:heavy metal translocating P-type ATPase [Desulfovibrionaceae bacterium]
MQKFRVTGMSCAACSARVEKAVQGVQGVTSCAVSLLTNSMGVEGDVSPSAIIAAVTKAGYGASVLNGETHESHNTPQVESFEEETHILLVRLIASLVLLVPLLYVSMGYSMWGLPVPDFFAGNPVGLGLLQLLLALLVMSINKKFFINGWQGLIKGAPNMDTLVALGSFAAFFWSTLQLFVLTKFQAIGISLQELATLQDFYFESAAMIVTLITVGKMLEARSKGKTTDALKNLMRLAPQTAVILRDGHEVEVAIKDVKAGDIFVVKPGAHIPVDGVVIEGVSSVNCAMLTGESMPQDIGVGDKVSAATQNLAGYLRCRAERVGEDTTLAQIIQLVSDAQATKAPVAKVADYVAGIFVPCVIGLAVVTAIIWLVCGAEMGFALARGIAVLVISCPCALGLATPVAIMVGSGLAAKSGILFKTAIALEQVGKIDIIALDKTGTVTRGTPEVTDILPYGDTSKEELIQIALSLESKSEHPLAQAILHMGEAKGLKPSNITDFQSITGSGVAGVLNHDHVYGGNLAYIKQYVAINSQEEKIAEDLSAQGKTPLFFALEGKLCGIIACADQIKPDSREAVESLQHLGLRVVLLTGDNAKTAQAIANEAHVDEVISDVLPADKEKVIRSLKQHGCVAMVGDGINDAPALTRADLGIAIGAGADIALDAADVVLMKSKLSDVPAAIRLGRATLRNIHQNLFWAFCYNIIGIPIAAGLLYPVFGLKLSPMLGALAMSLSSFCVVSNALRLNLFNPYKADQDAPKTTWQSELREDVHKLGKKVQVLLAHVFKKEDSALEDASKSVAEAGIQSQEYQVEINGMMCENCEAHVKKALAEIEHVTDVSASHETHTACFSYSGSLDFKNLQVEVEARVTKAGYQFISLKEAQKEAQKEAKTEAKSSDPYKAYQVEINGMMCENCEAHVKKALAEIDHVTDVSASHETHTACFSYSGSLDLKNLQAEVETRVTKAGYQFISLKEA